MNPEKTVREAVPRSGRLLLRQLGLRLRALHTASPLRVRLLALCILVAVLLYIVYVVQDLYLIDLRAQYGRLQALDWEQPLLAELVARLRGLSVRSTWMKYLSLVLVVAVSFAARPAVGQLRRAALNQAAFAFTLVADAYIMLIDRPTLGILMFCCVQVTRVVLFGGRKRAIAPLLLAIAALFVTLELSPYVSLTGQPTGSGALFPELARWFRTGGGQTEPPLHSQLAVRNGLAAAYGVLQLAALIYSFQTTSSVSQTSARFVGGRAERYAWRAGMLLFVACDIHVLLYNLLPPTQLLARQAAVLMWFFYFPSQLVLALAPTRFAAGGADLGSKEEQLRLDGHWEAAL